MIPFTPDHIAYYLVVLGLLACWAYGAIKAAQGRERRA